MTEKIVEIAPGKVVKVWTFGDRVPGPVVRVRVGDTVEASITNKTKMPHSIDFHAARIAPNKAFRDVVPGKSFTFEFNATSPGVFMYHCGTAPVVHHIANGMYGMIIVEPAGGPADGRPRAGLRPVRLLRLGHPRRAGRRRQADERHPGRGRLQRLRRPVQGRADHGQGGRADPGLRPGRRPQHLVGLPRGRHDLRPGLDDGIPGNLRSATRRSTCRPPRAPSPSSASTRRGSTPSSPTTSPTPPRAPWACSAPSTPPAR